MEFKELMQLYLNQTPMTSTPAKRIAEIRSKISFDLQTGNGPVKYNQRNGTIEVNRNFK